MVLKTLILVGGLSAMDTPLISGNGSLWAGMTSTYTLMMTLIMWTEFHLKEHYD